jgi:hypothetical protein
MPGSASDISGLKHLPCELPAGSTLLPLIATKSVVRRC